MDKNLVKDIIKEAEEQKWNFFTVNGTAFDMKVEVFNFHRSKEVAFIIMYYDDNKVRVFEFATWKDFTKAVIKFLLDY